MRGGEKAVVLAVLHVLAIGFEHARRRAGLRNTWRSDTSTKRVEVRLSRYLIRQDEGLPERVNATRLGGLGIDDFFALERGLLHYWLQNG